MLKHDQTLLLLRIGFGVFLYNFGKEREREKKKSLFFSQFSHLIKMDRTSDFLFKREVKLGI